jgi:hypothetical protein
MRETLKRFVGVGVFGVAMALLEAVVVIYLRGLLRVTPETVSLGPYLRFEVWREVATLSMLAAVGWLAGRALAGRLAFGAFAFGVWDIGYYAWLKVLIDWPANLLDWDILFLIPVRWWGPVLAPLLMAALTCAIAVLAAVRTERGQRVAVTRGRLGVAASGGLMMLYVFVADAVHGLLAGRPDWGTLRPGPFQWPLFLLGWGLMAAAGLSMLWLARDAGKRSATRWLWRPGKGRERGAG